MNVVCPDASCNAQYDIDPAQIPAGKKGFKCAQCGGFVPVDTEAASSSSTQATDGEGTPKSLIIILAVALLMIAGGAGFFYYQLQIINQGGLLVDGQTASFSNDRMIELKEKLRQNQLKEQEQAGAAEKAPGPSDTPVSGKI